MSGNGVGGWGYVWPGWVSGGSAIPWELYACLKRKNSQDFLDPCELASILGVQLISVPRFRKRRDECEGRCPGSVLLVLKSVGVGLGQSERDLST